MNVSTTLPPEIVAALAPAAVAVEAEARAATVNSMYSTVARAAKATVRHQGNEYRPGIVAIIGQAFPDRQQTFAEELYDGRRVDVSRPQFSVTATSEDEDENEDEDEDSECEQHCSACGCCTECDGRHDGDGWDTLIGPNGDERCQDCAHWCND